MSQPPDQPRKKRPASQKTVQPKKSAQTKKTTTQRKEAAGTPSSAKKTTKPKSDATKTTAATKKTPSAKKTSSSKSAAKAKAAKANQTQRKEQRPTADRPATAKETMSQGSGPSKRPVRPRPVVLPERTRWFHERRRRSYFPIWVAVLLWVVLILVWVYVSPRLPPIAPPGQPIPVKDTRPTPTPHPGLLFPDFRE